MNSKTTMSSENSAALANQEAIKSTSTDISKLEKAISKCESQVAEKQAEFPKIDPLVSQRQDLLAAMAIGDDKKSELKKLDADIELLAAKQKVAKPALDTLKQTLDGLQRRLVESQSILAELQKQNSILVRNLLLARAEALGEEYVETGMVLIKQYQRLMAMNELLMNHGFKTHIVAHGEGLQLPSFMLDAMVGKNDRLRPHMIFTSTTKNGRDTQSWVEQEKEKLIEIGIHVL